MLSLRESLLIGLKLTGGEVLKIFLLGVAADSLGNCMEKFFKEQDL